MTYVTCLLVKDESTRYFLTRLLPIFESSIQKIDFIFSLMLFFPLQVHPSNIPFSFFFCHPSYD